MLFNSVPSLNHHSNWTAIRGIVSKNHNSQGKMTMNKLPGLFFAETFQLGRSSSYGPNYYVLRMSHPASTPLTPPTVITVSEACTWVADTHLATYSLRRSSQWRSEKRAMSWGRTWNTFKIVLIIKYTLTVIITFFFQLCDPLIPLPSSPPTHPPPLLSYPHHHQPIPTTPSCFYLLCQGQQASQTALYKWKLTLTLTSSNAKELLLCNAVIIIIQFKVIVLSKFKVIINMKCETITGLQCWLQFSSANHYTLQHCQPIHLTWWTCPPHNTICSPHKQQIHSP